MRPIDNLTDIVVFAHIASGGSLSAAARQLELSLAVVSKRLARLEQTLGVRLVNRTTRRLSLTEEGVAFHRHCTRILSEIKDAQDAVGSRGSVARGLVRVTATAAFSRRQIAPRLARFHLRHPEVQVQVIATDSVIDLVQNGIDLAIRQAVLPDSTLITQELAPNRRIACAAPDYLARKGIPLRPEDLSRHDCIVFGAPPRTTWSFECGQAEAMVVPVTGSVITNDGEVAHAAALAGAGIVLKSIWDVTEDIRAGRLVALLAAYRSPATPIQAVYPSARHLAAKVRVFLEFLAEELKAAVRDLYVPDAPPHS
jgi:DNA-binding transcriptional LysR family regulator